MISTAIQKGPFVNVYDEDNHTLFSVNGELYGFTSTTVSVQKGPFVNVYDERGRQISSYSVR